MISSSELHPIPLYQHLYQIYPDIPQYSQQHKRIQRYQLLNKRFSHIYGKSPQYFVKCPGSLTLFGDSSDYSSLSILECGTPNDTVAIFAQNNTKEIRINHIEKSRYPEQRVGLEDGGDIREGDEWRNLVVIALRVVEGLGKGQVTGMDVLVDSQLLEKNQLGKTSSYLYSLVLGIAAISKQIKQLKKQDIFRQLSKYNSKFQKLTIRQTALYTENHQLLDSFTKQLFPFDKQYTFVMAHSCTPFSEKSMQIKEGKRGNLKRCQVRIGIEIIKTQLGIEKEINNLSNFVCYLEELKQNLGYNTEELIECVEEYIPNQLMTVEEIQATTEKSLIEILKLIPYSNNIIEHYKSFHPYNLIIFLLKQQLLIQSLKSFLLSLSQSTSPLKQIFLQSRQLQLKHLSPPSTETSKLIQIAGEIAEGRCFKVVGGDERKGNVVFLVEKKRGQYLVDHLTKSYYGGKEVSMMLADDVERYVYEVMPTMGVAVLDPQYEIWL